MQRRATTQDISWFLDLRRNDQIDLNPPYQRKSVWNLKDRRFFLDTVFRGYPCPALFLHKVQNAAEKTIYAVVDGKQRLQTVFQFVDDELALASDYGDARYAGKRWSQLGSTEKQVFWNYVLPVEFLTFDPNDPQEVNQAFDRLNRNMRKLEAQELRHARWDGWFLTTVESLCEDPLWRKIGVGSAGRSKRMKDAQFISELLLVVLEGQQHGFDQQALDTAYAKFDEIADEDALVDPQEVVDTFSTARDYLAEMQEANGCLKQHARSLSVLYTLWVLIVLHRDVLPEPGALAEIFVHFKGRIDELAAASDKGAALLGGPEASLYELAASFAEGLRGAATDLKPRQKRLDALREYVVQVEA